MAEEKKKKTGLIVAICAAVVVAIAAVVTVLVINLNKGNAVVGKYNLYATVDSEGNESTSIVDFLKAFGASETIEFKEDKTGLFEIKANGGMFSAFTEGEDSNNSNTSVPFTWDDKKIKSTSDAGNLDTEYTYKDDTVTLTYDGQSLKFKREGK